MELLQGHEGLPKNVAHIIVLLSSREFINCLIIFVAKKWCLQESVVAALQILVGQSEDLVVFLSLLEKCLQDFQIFVIECG